jgi:hypothetical protein
VKASRTPLLVLGALVVAITAASTWWAGRQEAQVGAQVAALAGPGDIRMLSSDTCGICTWPELVHRSTRSHAECVIERDAACKLEFRPFSPRHAGDAGARQGASGLQSGAFVGRRCRVVAESLAALQRVSQG